MKGSSPLTDCLNVGCVCHQEQLATELEARVKQLTLEVESGNALRQRVMQEKAELELHIAAISSELQEASRR